MPDLVALDRIAAGHGVGFALLLFAVLALSLVVKILWAENRRLYTEKEQLLLTKSEVYEKLLREERRDRTVRRLDS